MAACIQQNSVTIGFHQGGETPFTQTTVSPTSMVESTVILSARICAGELATLSAGAWPFADFGPIAEIQSAATAEIEITKRKRFLTRATSLR